MASIQIRNAPEDLHEALRRRAAAQGVSIRDYVLGLLRRDLALPSQEQWLATVVSREPSDPLDSVAAVHAARAERDAQLRAAGGY